MSFNTWLDTFIEEQEIDLTECFEVEGPVYGTNYMQIQNVVDAIKTTSPEEKNAIKNKIVMLDFQNQPIVPFFKHLAQAIAL
jgi:hypothetical protein